MITITKERDQSYSTIDFSKAKTSNNLITVIAQSINERFWCIWGNKTVMLVDSAMLEGIIKSGAVDHYMHDVTMIEK